MLVLLTRREKAWIVGNITVSKAIQRDIRYRIRRKLEILCSEELPPLMNKGFFGHEFNVLCEQGKFVFNADPRSVVANDDGVASNGAGYNDGGGRWSNLVKIQPLTVRKVKDNRVMPANVESKTISKNAKWAGSDLNQRPPPCQGKSLSKEISSTDGSKSTSHDFWSSFQSYLSKNNNHLGTRDRLNYAMKYAYILDTGDARQLLELSHEKRMHIMKSLSALAKYTGRYDRWQQVRQRFQLKWSNGDSLQAFNSIFNKEKDLDHMISWLKDTCSKLPRKYANVLRFNTLTGLRPSESFLSIRLINKSLQNYLNDDTKILEHFRFPDFIRRTKKAYISIVNDRILEIARSAHEQVSYNQLKWEFKRDGVRYLHMLFCRKIFATYLRIQGVEQEIIDLLQGRIPRNIFLRHYFRPNFSNENQKVIKSLENLYEETSYS